MSDAYTVYWPRDRCRRLAAVVTTGRALEVLFGGPHLSEPSFRRAQVTAGDLVYPITVDRQVLYVLGRMRVTDIVTPGAEGIGHWFDRFPLWRWLASFCTTEVVLGTEGIPLRLDAALPGDVLRRLTYRSRRGSRTVAHVSDDGRLVHSLGVQGIYRLAPPCAADLDAVLARPRATPVA
ncbi:hypothetical protein NCC78_31665, partial [Micromonospora phytophila]|uniref:hypothetical protein n=1 Tax=Micromonospora phytophila TaxID=709888 RepID=UPI00202E189B